VWLASLIVVASALQVFGGNIADPDLWGHVHYGEAVLSGEGIPREEIFSYTAAGSAFYNHEWLSDVVFAFLYGVGGSAALIAFKLACCVVMLAAMIDASRSLAERLMPGVAVHPLVRAGVLVVALAAIAPGATFRPQLFTMVLLAVELALLLRGDRRLRSGAAVLPVEIGVLPVLFVVWANVHGGFLVGLGLACLYGAATIGEGVVAAVRRQTPAVSVRALAVLAAVLLVAAFAPLANPYGVELYTYLARTLDMHGEISEWRPVAPFSTQYLPFKALCLAVIALITTYARTSRDAWRIPVLWWLVPYIVVAAVAGFRHQRHTVLFAITAAPLLIVLGEVARRSVLELWPALARPRRELSYALVSGAVLISLAQLQGVASQYARDGLNIRFGRLDYPIDAVEFLRTHGIRGNVAMPFEWGAYAISKLAPESRVFIDGRFEAVYPQQVIDDYFAFMHGTEGWQRLLDDYPTDVVVVQRWRNIHPRLFTHPDFAYVYSDPAALVFVRRSPETDATLVRLASVDRTAFERHPTVFP